MMHLHVVTGHCPQTEAELRLELAEWAEEAGDYRQALEYRAIVARWRRDWRTQGPLAKAGNPDAPLRDLGVMWWHDREEHGVVCPCGHFTTHLCDEPMGRGRTCDMPMCKCCRNEVREGVDLCPIHVARERTVASLVAQTLRNDEVVREI